MPIWEVVVPKDRGALPWLDPQVALVTVPPGVTEIHVVLNETLATEGWVSQPPSPPQEGNQLDMPTGTFTPSLALG